MYHFRKAMDVLYLICVMIAGIALVLISAVIPWGVYTRYVLNSAASWPEPTAVLLTIWLTFFDALAEIAMVAMAIFMTVYGTRLVIATWYNSIADFPELSVGVTYLPIPLGGAILFLFVIERMICGPPPIPASHH